MPMSENKKFLIIDGNALVHRAYHALPPLTTKRGEVVNAVYGFLLVFLKALKDIKPDYVAATFDLAGPTFRHKQFKEYKAKRVKAPDELYQQLPRVKEILTAFDVPIYEKEGFEADDVIGTLTVKAPAGVESVILSGDLDNLQLVNEKTKVYTLRKGIKDTILYDVDEAKKRYDGLLPEQLQDYRGLRGDASDNIPGVSGIGEKTAIELLKTFGSLDNLYKEIEKGTKKAAGIKPSLLQKLKDNKEQALLSQDLAKIHCDVPIDFKLADCEFGRFDLETTKRALAKYEFNTLIQKLPEFINYKNQLAVKAGQVGLFGTSVKQEDNILIDIERLESQGIFSKQIAQVERDLIPVVKKMEQNGIKIDIAQLNTLSKTLEQKIARLQKNIFEKAGCEFNPNSPQQLSEVLFEKLQVSPLGIRKTPGGVISTGADELKKIRDSHPVVGLILQYRELFKLKSGFVDSLSVIINPKDGRIHPHFHQLGTETGRMSCSNPNLQNIPIKSELGRLIRQCFVAEQGYSLLSADYSQVELRIVAWLAGDKAGSELFRQGKDIHILTASRIFSIKPAEVSKAQRDFAKTLNYAILYGMGANGFARRAGIDRQKAKEFIERYFSEFEEIADFMKEQKDKARENGYCQTYFGRKRFLNEINSSDSRFRSQAERTAANMPVQGTAADIMKMAMVEIGKSVLNNDCRLILQIHDELLFEIKRDKIEQSAKKIKSAMENIVKDKVFLAVGTKVGDNWGEMSVNLE